MSKKRFKLLAFITSAISVCLLIVFYQTDFFNFQSLFSSQADVTLDPDYSNGVVIHNSPQKLPTASGYVFLADLNVSGQPIQPDDLEWLTTDGQFIDIGVKVFNHQALAYYKTPTQANSNVKVTVQLKSDHNLRAETSFAVISNQLNPLANDFPHIAHHAFPSLTDNNGQVLDSRTQFLDKYPVITTRGDSIAETANVKSRNPNLISLRFTQTGSDIGSFTIKLGLNPTTFTDPNNLTDPTNWQNATPYEEQPWPGFWLYLVGANLAEDLANPGTNITNNLLVKVTGDQTTLFAAGDYLVFFDDQNNDGQVDTPAVKDWELARIASANDSSGNPPVYFDAVNNQTLLTLESRGAVNFPAGLEDEDENYHPRFFKVSEHKTGSLVRPLAAPRDYPAGFKFNFTEFSDNQLNLKDPNGFTVNQWLTVFFIHNLNRDFANGQEYNGTTNNGWKFDYTPYWTHQITVNGQNVDSNLDGIADGGTFYDQYPKGEDAVGEGRIKFWQYLRQLGGDGRMIIGDTEANRGYASLNGVEFEGFPAFQNGNLPTTLNQYLEKYNQRFFSYQNDWLDPSLSYPRYTELFTKRPNAIFYNTSDPTANPTIPDWARKTATNNLARLDFASAMIEDGYYIYSPHPQSKVGGEDYWLDEFDGGLGASLKQDVRKLTGNQSIDDPYDFDEVYQLADNQFKPGDIWLIEQEEVEIISFTPVGPDPENNNLNFGQLTVLRGRNNSFPEKHPRGTKLFKKTPTDPNNPQDTELEQVKTPYLGQPTGPAANLAQLDPNNLIQNGDFQADSSNWSGTANTQLTIINDPDPNRQKVAEVATTKAVPTKNPQTYRKPNHGISQNLTLAKNQEYTLKFWAKAEARSNIKVQVILQDQVPDPTDRVYDQAVELTDSWRQYQYSFVTNNSPEEPIYNLSLEGFREYYKITLDNISLQKGGYHIYRRDFDNGIILTNGSNSPINFDLGSETFVHINGSQDHLANNGTEVTGIYTLGALDSRVLLKKVEGNDQDPPPDDDQDSNDDSPPPDDDNQNINTEPPPDDEENQPPITSDDQSSNQSDGSEQADSIGGQADQADTELGLDNFSPPKNQSNKTKPITGEVNSNFLTETESSLQQQNPINQEINIPLFQLAIKQAKSLNQVELVWDRVSGASRYQIYRDNIQIKESQESFSTDTIEPGIRYSYQIAAIDENDNLIGRSQIINLTLAGQVKIDNIEVVTSGKNQVELKIQTNVPAVISVNYTRQTFWLWFKQKFIGLFNKNYQPKLRFRDVLSPNEASNLHSALLTNLKKKSTYYYQIRLINANDPKNYLNTEIQTFRTAN